MAGVVGAGHLLLPERARFAAQGVRAVHCCLAHPALKGKGNPTGGEGGRPALRRLASSKA